MSITAQYKVTEVKPRKEQTLMSSVLTAQGQGLWLEWSGFLKIFFF